MKINGDTKVIEIDEHGNDIMDKSINQLLNDTPIEENVSRETSEGGFEIDLSFFKKATGEGDIEQYKNHMMNPLKSEGIAHILRGLTGIVGTDMNFALIDIVVGIFKLTKGKKSGVNDAS